MTSKNTLKSLISSFSDYQFNIFFQRCSDGTKPFLLLLSSKFYYISNLIENVRVFLKTCRLYTIGQIVSHGEQVGNCTRYEYKIRTCSTFALRKLETVLYLIHNNIHQVIKHECLSNLCSFSPNQNYVPLSCTKIEASIILAFQCFEEICKMETNQSQSSTTVTSSRNLAERTVVSEY